jgi:phage replication-related protein YjqB (UPF0714/DUF867 family)
MAHEDRYPDFATLARKEREGRHFRITAVARPGAPIAVIAPHGGAIERRTGDIARAIAGPQFSYYLFEGIRATENYARLHLTSRRFDEPQCLALVRDVETVVAIHGCEDLAGRVYVGGRDDALAAALTSALGAAGLELAPAGHEFGATDADNICNRGRSGRGVQLELPRAVRGGPFEMRFVRAVREVLLARVRDPEA